MQDGRVGDINPWGLALFRTIRAAEPSGTVQETAFAKWLDQTSDREEARRDRIHGAAGITPTTIWVVLLLSAAIVFAFMLFFADPAEMKRSQAMLVGSATTIVVVTLLAIFALDNPYRPGLGKHPARGDGALARDPRRGAGSSGHRGSDSVRRAGESAMKDRAELVATVLLAFAAVATAWSGYQATRWNGEQAKASSRTNAIRIDAARAQGLSEAQKEVDVATYHPVGRRLRPSRDRAHDVLRETLSRGVQARVRRVARDEAVDERAGAVDAVRHAAVHARRRGGGGAARRRGRGVRSVRSGATSSARRTTSSASSSSPSRCSSRARARSSRTHACAPSPSEWAAWCSSERSSGWRRSR